MSLESAQMTNLGNMFKRFELIDHTSMGKGRMSVRHDVVVEYSEQDDGKTLKVFLRDQDAQVTESCGCVFCDIDLKPRLINGRWMHEVTAAGRQRLLACRKEIPL